jgi:hypothetical protein
MSVTATIECEDGVQRKFWGQDHRDLLVAISKKLDVGMAEKLEANAPLSKTTIVDRPVTPRLLAAAAGITNTTAHKRLDRALRYGHAIRLGVGSYQVTTRDDLALSFLLAPLHPGAHRNLGNFSSPNAE